MKRAVQENGFHSPVTKKQKIEIQEEDEEEVERESFVCILCEEELARDQDFLGVSEEDMEPHAIVGFFRNVFNVDQEHSADPGPGHEHDFFTAYIFCSQCCHVVGALILRVTVSPEYQPEQHFVVGNYVMILNWLRIRRGNLLLNAVTREVVEEYIHD